DDGKDPVLVDYSKAFFPVLLAVLILRSFIAEPFRIPSNSMMPTLLTGDFILVNKFAYGLRLPINNHKFVDLGAPERGDVVVFRPPHHPDQDWIKRVMGLPGDRIAYRDNTVFINGEPLRYEALGAYRGI
ncbi:signal peptidase I, partial [Lysobacter sp. A3-1-A15]